MAKRTTTGTVPSSGRGGTAAATAQNEQTAEEHSTLEQKPPGRLDHPEWCVVYMLVYITIRKFGLLLSSSKVYTCSVAVLSIKVSKTCT